MHLLFCVLYSFEGKNGKKELVLLLLCARSLLTFAISLILSFFQLSAVASVALFICFYFCLQHFCSSKLKPESPPDPFWDMRTIKIVRSSSAYGFFGALVRCISLVCISSHALLWFYFIVLLICFIECWRKRLKWNLFSWFLNAAIFLVFIFFYFLQFMEIAVEQLKLEKWMRLCAKSHWQYFWQNIKKLR